MRNPPEPDKFNPIVWEIVKQIPPGQVSTYGQIAAMIPPPEGVSPPDYQRLGSRWVGTAMNNTPAGQGIPWQRVINSKGMISLPEGSRAALEQRERLESEGVSFDEKGRVNFEVCGWDGPDESWLRERGLYPPPSLKKNPGGANQMRLF
jgi:methylated-DNA-protein-cysteine methyltransferase related protein